MKLLLNNSYGTSFSIGKESEIHEAENYLMRKGYTRIQANRILDGDCPRDLPVLHEVFEKFGEGETSRLVYREMPDQPYYIQSFSGCEEVLTPSNFNNPGDPFDPELKEGDWEKVDVNSEEGCCRLVQILNSFVEDKEKGTAFEIAHVGWVEESKAATRLISSFFIPKGVLDVGVDKGLWAYGPMGKGAFPILGSEAFSEANFEVVHSLKTLRVFFLQGKLGENTIKISAL